MKEETGSSTSPKDSAAQPSWDRNFNFGHLLAPTDFSPESERAVEYAVQLARRLGARLTLLHVNPPPSALGYSVGGGVSTEQIEEWQKEAEKELADQLARVKLEYENVDSVQRTGLPSS
jgi:nucleotide-binding universal stress UspA family protein